jgi:hypothetical protein
VTADDMVAVVEPVAARREQLARMFPGVAVVADAVPDCRRRWSR